MLHALKANCPALSVTIYSGEDEATGRRMAGAIGRFDYVVKGDPAQLVGHVRAAVERLVLAGALDDP